MEEKRFSLGVEKSEHLGVSPDKKLATAGVDLGSRKRVDFNLHDAGAAVCSGRGLWI